MVKNKHLHSLIMKYKKIKDGFVKVVSFLYDLIFMFYVPLSASD